MSKKFLNLNIPKGPPKIIFKTLSALAESHELDIKELEKQQEFLRSRKNSCIYAKSLNNNYLQLRPFNNTLLQLVLDLMKKGTKQEFDIIIQLFSLHSYHNFPLITKCEERIDTIYKADNIEDFQKLIKFFKVSRRNPFSESVLIFKISEFLGNIVSQGGSLPKIEDLLIIYDLFEAFEAFYYRYSYVTNQIIYITGETFKKIEIDHKEFEILFDLIKEIQEIRFPLLKRKLEKSLFEMIFDRIEQIFCKDLESPSKILFFENNEGISYFLGELLENGKCEHFINSFCKNVEKLSIEKINEYLQGIIDFLTKPKYSSEKKMGYYNYLVKIKKKLLEIRPNIKGRIKETSRLDYYLNNFHIDISIND